MSENNLESLVNQLSELSVMQIAQLTKTLEEKWGVKAAPVMAAAPVAAATGGAAEAAVQKTEFNVTLLEAGPDKLKVIKALRDALGLPLPEAKAVADGAPKKLKEGVSKEEADTLKKKLEEVGAKVEVA